MNFRLEKQPPGKTLTKFFVKGDSATVGVISISNNEVQNFLTHWQEVPQSSPATTAVVGKPDRAVGAMVAAARKKGPASKTSILRGC